MTQVIVHSKPNCVQCTATYRKLNQLRIPYTIAALTDESVAQFKRAGHLSAPVVTHGEHSFSGYRPDLLEALATITPAAAEGEDPE